MNKWEFSQVEGVKTGQLLAEEFNAAVFTE